MIYGRDQLNAVTEGVDMDALTEMMIYDDISRGTEEQIKEFCESPEAQALVEAGKLRKPTLVRLGKSDDLKRRKKMAAFELAKESNDPTWKKLVANRKKEKQFIAAIMKKYGNKAEKVAKVAQKDYMKSSSKATAKAKK